MTTSQEPVDYATKRTWTATSIATVPTDRASRYGKQLITHMSRKTGGDWNADFNIGILENFFGNGCLNAKTTADALVLEIHAKPEALAKIEEIVGVHLARFGHKDNMAVTWVRADGKGSTQGPFSEEDMQRMAAERTKREATKGVQN
ncbi:MAG: DUF2218 domain-containing protein [Corynebacterium sp.]|nr:DUF2218 domain-containing protein [Corynebacterium sp.]